MGTDQAAPALADLRVTIDDAAGAIAAIPDGREMFRQASELAKIASELAEVAAELRSQAARRIQEDEALSLAGLGEQISMSKARAAQLVNRGKRSDTRTTEG